MTLLAMERRTISSTVPRLEQLPGISAGPVAALRRAGVDSPFELARADPAGLAEAAALDAGVADSLVETARLVTLRGIGTAHAARLRAVGVGTVAQLAARHSEELWLALRQDGNASYRPTAAEVRVWVGRAECRMLNAEC
jgi:nucleotidyltransferase/DNA polymerase involved in DNA repair